MQVSLFDYNLRFLDWLRVCVKIEKVDIALRQMGVNPVAGKSLNSYLCLTVWLLVSARLEQVMRAMS